MLKSSREAYRRQGKVMPNPTRLTKVHLCEHCVAAWYQMAARASRYAVQMPFVHKPLACVDASQDIAARCCCVAVGSVETHILRACAPHAGAAQHVPHQARPHGARHRHGGCRPADEQRLAVVRQRPMTLSNNRNMCERGRHNSQVLLVQQLLEFASYEDLRCTTHSGSRLQGN